MINAIRRTIRRVKGTCLSCGEVPVKGTPHCWDCSLRIIADYDETLGELVAKLTEKPVYHQDEDDPINEPKIGSAESKF